MSSSTVWIGYEIAPLDAIAKTHPTAFEAFATEQAASEWANEVNLRDHQLYGYGRHILKRELRGMTFPMGRRRGR